MVQMAKFVIDGQPAKSVGGEVTEVRNPADGSVVGTVPRGNREDARRAIDAAEQALKVWSKTAPAARGEVLRKAARLIDQHVKELAESLT